MEFEDILNQVGGYGKYQKQLVMFFAFPMTIVFACVSMNSLFIMSVPNHWCHGGSVTNSNLIVSHHKPPLSALDDPRCTMYDVNYTENSDGNYTFGTKVVTCSTGWQYDKSGYDSTASTKWNLVCNDRYFASLVLTLESIGSLIFTPFYGYSADRYGRKMMYLLAAVVSSVTEVASVMVEDFTGFVVLRTIHGGVLPTAFTLPFLLILELVETEKRAHMNGLYNMFWTAGYCILPLIAYLSRSWVNLSLICSVTCAFNLLYYKFIPESPSWLMSEGRYEDATTIMEQIGIKNGKPQNRAYLFNQIQELGSSIQKKKQQEKSSSAYLLIKSPIMRKRFLIFIFCWMAFYLIFFGMLYNLRNLSGNEFLNFFLLNIVEVPGNILFWILLHKVGRRWTSSIGYVTVGLVCLGPLTGFLNSNIICSMIGKFIITGNYMVTDQQATELFPTAGEVKTEFPFTVMALMALIAGILTAFLPETLNQNLPQTITDAEKIGKDEKFFSWIRKKTPNNIDESSVSEARNRRFMNASEVEVLDKSVLCKQNSQSIV